jgi:hypothetical protein
VCQSTANGQRLLREWAEPGILDPATDKLDPTVWVA